MAGKDLTMHEFENSQKRSLKPWADRPKRRLPHFQLDGVEDGLLAHGLDDAAGAEDEVPRPWQSLVSCPAGKGGQTLREY